MAEKASPTPVSVRSLRECAQLCTGEETGRAHPQDGCKSIYYNDVDKKCMLVVGRNAKLNDAAFDANSKWMRFG